MSSSLNKAMLIGHLGKDPEVKYMPSGDAVTNITLATSETYKDKNGDKQDKCEWHNIVFFKRLAEIAGEYLKKGALIYVEGKMQTRKWQDKEGKDRYTTEIIASEMKMLGGKSQGDSRPHEPESAPPAPKKIDEQPKHQIKNTAFADFDDDIPF